MDHAHAGYGGLDSEIGCAPNADYQPRLRLDQYHIAMQVALTWLLRRSPNILLIPGTSSVGHLRENLAAAALELPEAEIKALDDIGG